MNDDGGSEAGPPAGESSSAGEPDPRRSATDGEPASLSELGRGGGSASLSGGSTSRAARKDPAPTTGVSPSEEGHPASGGERRASGAAVREAARFLDVASSSQVAFDDPRLEGRRLFSELWGTFLLVLVAAGAPVVAHQEYGSGLTMVANVLAPGMMVMGIIFFMGTVSGAHLNPSVTLAFAVRRNFPWRRVPGYLVAQFVGATLAAWVLEIMFGDVMNGGTLPADGVSSVTAVLTEFLLTLGLVSVILGTASGARNIGANAAIATGAYIGLVVAWAAPVTGASMNPFRSLGPALIGADLRHYWIYVVGPIAGALVAVAFETVLRGMPTAAGRRAAEGLLDPGNPAGL